MRIVIGILVVALAVCVYAVVYQHPAAGQESTTLERKVEGQVLTSASAPKVTVTIDPRLIYVGGQKFLLYNVANAEQHFFVEADEKKRIKRLYWYQFEGYLPSNTHTYDYSDQPIKFRHGGLEWLADASAGATPTAEKRPDSDGARFRALLRAKGFVLPPEFMLLRMVNLDAAKRNELMVIYMEDLSPLGLKGADLKEGGSAHAKWEELQKGLMERAKAGMKVE